MMRLLLHDETRLLPTSAENQSFLLREVLHFPPLRILCSQPLIPLPNCFSGKLVHLSIIISDLCSKASFAT